jgi:hypothetical protein
VTIDEVRAFASTLPRSSEAFVRGRVKFRIGRIVYLSFSRDGAVMGFAFPKDWRNALVESEPQKFSLPGQSDLRYHWVDVQLAAIDAEEMRELVEDAWAFTVPQRVAEEYAASRGYDSADQIASATRLPDPAPLAGALGAPPARTRGRTGSAQTSAPPRG